MCEGAFSGIDSFWVGSEITLVFWEVGLDTHLFPY